jgi:hypothetical protein
MCPDILQSSISANRENGFLRHEPRLFLLAVKAAKNVEGTKGAEDSAAMGLQIYRRNIHSTLIGMLRTGKSWCVKPISVGSCSTGPNSAMTGLRTDRWG